MTSEKRRIAASVTALALTVMDEAGPVDRDWYYGKRKPSGKNRDKVKAARKQRKGKK